jgi:radical SAM superfamily enzyme YgiQ (UPF0313 family)
MSDILLTTLNARYTHSSIGLRCLYANMGTLQQRTEIVEFTIRDNMQDVAEQLLTRAPKIIGFGVYIWNALQMAEVVGIIRQVAPEVTIILGGPEVSHAPLRVDFSAADYIVQGEGDVAFGQICQAIVDGNPPAGRTITAEPVELDAIELPYRFYSDADIRNRNIYVEASRGCPFRCEFCLSSIDERVRDLFIDRFLQEMELLWQRGVRSYRFIDRTFNLNVRTASRLLDFFLEKPEPCFLHFEVIPDHFPSALRERIARFPAAALQLEVGIQTLNPEVARTIQRNLKLEKIEENIRYLATTHAHMHLDLIVGLPGESLESFAANLDRLCSWTDAEIQVGILKKLSGTTLARHDARFGMRYSAQPPFDLLQNDLIPFAEMQRMKRFARFWDLCYNSGNFKTSIRMLWPAGDVYAQFSAFCDWLYGETRMTWQISLDRLAGFLFRYLIDEQGHHELQVAQAMADDLMKIEGRKLPACLRPYLDRITLPNQQAAGGANSRQLRHL